MATIRDRLEHRWAARRMSSYVDGALGAEQRRRLQRHVDRCPECGPMLRTLVRLTGELRDLRGGPERSIAARVIEHWRESDRERASSGGGRGDGP